MSSETAVKVGETVRKVRQIRGLSIRECARKAGMSTRTLQDIEKGHGSATLSTFARLAHALDASVSVLFTPAERVQEVPAWYTDLVQRIERLEATLSPEAPR